MKLRSKPVVWSLLLLSCQPANDAQTAVRFTSTDSAGVQVTVQQVAAQSPLCRGASEPQRTFGEQTSDSVVPLFGVTDAVWLDSGAVAVAQERVGGVWIFNSHGEPQKLLGRHGNGPGEFRSVWRVWPGPNGFIAIGDARPWRIQHFSKDMGTPRVTTFDPPVVNRPVFSEILFDGSFVIAEECCRVSAPEFSRTELIVRSYSSAGRLRDTLARLPFGRIGRLSNTANASWMRPLFEAGSSIASNGAEIALGDQRRPEVRIVKPDGTPIRIVRWSWVGRSEQGAVTSEDIEQYRRDRIMQSSQVNEQFVKEDVSEDRPVNDSFPKFSRLLLSEDGNLWVRLYKRPGEAREKYLRFSSEGALVCVLTLPETQVLLRVRTDTLLVLDRSIETGELVRELVLRR